MSNSVLREGLLIFVVLLGSTAHAVAEPACASPDHDSSVCAELVSGGAAASAGLGDAGAVQAEAWMRRSGSTATPYDSFADVDADVGPAGPFPGAALAAESWCPDVSLTDRRHPCGYYTVHGAAASLGDDARASAGVGYVEFFGGKFTWGFAQVETTWTGRVVDVWFLCWDGFRNDPCIWLDGHAEASAAAVGGPTVRVEFARSNRDESVTACLWADGEALGCQEVPFPVHVP